MFVDGLEGEVTAASAVLILLRGLPVRRDRTGCGGRQNIGVVEEDGGVEQVGGAEARRYGEVREGRGRDGQAGRLRGLELGHRRRAGEQVSEGGGEGEPGGVVQAPCGRCHGEKDIWLIERGVERGRTGVVARWRLLK